jgi:hypothetical protein
MVSTQLRNLSGVLRTTGYSLVPSGLTVEAWVQNTLEEIRQIPASVEAATAQVGAAMVGVRVALQAAASSAGSALLDALGAALEVLLDMAGCLVSPLIIIGPLPNAGGGGGKEA